MSGRPGWLDDSLEEEWIEPDEIDMSLDHDDDAHDAHQLSKSVLVSPVAATHPDQGEQQLRQRHLVVDPQQRHASASGSSVTAVPSSPSLPPPLSPSSPSPREGTFLIREDIQHQPVTPAAKAAGFPFGKGKGKGRGNQFEAFTKSIFSPLALEKMFDPPSPPLARKATGVEDGNAHSKLQSPLIPLPHPASTSSAHHDSPSHHNTSKLLTTSPLQAELIEEDEGRPDEILASDIPNLLGFNGRVPSARFTFHISHGPTSSSTPRSGPTMNRSGPTATHTKMGISNKPHAGLKLFQNYDTYTKDHLSALVESIDVKSSPPGANDTEEDSFVYGRSSKRIRLTPPEQDRRGTATIQVQRGPAAFSNVSPERRPPLSRPDSRTGPRDYLGESRSLMEQIKNNRSFSLATTLSKRDTEGLSLVNEGEDEDEGTPMPAPTRRPTYMMQAASLMAQIKSDVHNKENDDPQHVSRSSRTGTGKWSDVSSIHQSFDKLSISKPNTLRGEPQWERTRSASPPTIVIEPNSPTESLPDLPLPLINEPARESSISPRRTPLPFSSSINSEAAIQDADLSTRAPGAVPHVRSLPVPGLESAPSRVPSMSTVPSSSRFTAVSGQRSGSGVSTSSSIGSSTTATTHSQASVGSNIKRAGSPGAPRIRTIAPDEVGPISRVGDMQWDPVRMMWTKDRTRSQNLKRDRTVIDEEDDESDMEPQEDISEDVFRDIESLKDGTTTGSLNLGRSIAHSRASSASSARRSFASQRDRQISRSPSPHLHEPSVKNETVAALKHRQAPDDDERSDSDARQPLDAELPDQDSAGADEPYSDFDDEYDFESGVADPDTGRTPSQLSVGDEDVDQFSAASVISGETSNADMQRNFESTFSDDEEEDHQPEVVNPPTSRRTTRVDPAPATPHHQTPAATPRPILIPSQSTPHPFPHTNGRTRPPIALVPPRSALKQTPSPSNVAGPSTPATTGKYHRSHRRSVSFSDGRKDGKILNVSVTRLAHSGDGSADESAVDHDSGDDGQREATNVSIAQSMRARRIEGMLAALEEASVEDGTPSKSNPPHYGQDSSILVPLSARTSTFSRSASDGVARSRSGSLSSAASDSIGGEAELADDPEHRPQQQVARRDISIVGNQTILTEASFAVTQDRLVQVITQVHPYEAHWENLPEIDLSGFNVESVTKMKDYLPALVNLNLHKNQLAYLTGVPPHVRTLRISNNQLTDLTSYSHIRNLEYLDISYNQIESLSQLACLSRLHDLRAEGNQIRSLDGLEGMSHLVKLSLKKNKIARVNFGDYEWPRLEVLDLSSNSLTAVKALSTLQRLTLLNLDHNKLTSLSSSRPLTRLRILRVSDNRLTEFQAAPFLHLRTLYLDGNRLRQIHDLNKLPKLENLSLRNQAGGHLELASTDVQDIKRLYLSGNPFVDLAFLSTPCYNLVYVELAGCRISVLPANLSAVIPNVRVLNLNYNFIADVGPIWGLNRLKRLTLVGSRLKGTKTFLKALRNMPDIEMIDIRMNPSTLGWYLPLLVRDIPGALQPSEHGAVFPSPDQPHSDAEHDDEDRAEYSAVRLHPFSNRARRSAVPRRGTEALADAVATKPKRGQNATWEDLDSKFRRDLPNDSYLGRLSYRGLVMRACPKVQVIDGVRVTNGERDKAEQYLEGILKARQQATEKHI